MLADAKIFRKAMNKLILSAKVGVFVSQPKFIGELVVMYCHPKKSLIADNPEYMICKLELHKTSISLLYSIASAQIQVRAYDYTTATIVPAAAKMWEVIKTLPTADPDNNTDEEDEDSEEEYNYADSLEAFFEEEYSRPELCDF
jgi:hypothetical protein